ncbi:MAG: hypothetical protein AB7Q00_01785 [Phycisphaerales bacterium]
MFSNLKLYGDGDHAESDGIIVEWMSAVHECAEWSAVRYTHPDRITIGRRWVTEVGMRRASDVFICSVLLRSEETSAMVDPRVQTTRPKLVAKILEQCKVSSDTCGGSPRTLRTSDADLFLYEVNNPSRQHPIVQISPTPHGTYLIDPAKAASQLIGVATVAAIAPDADTYELEDLLSPRFSCYHGAVNIIWPVGGHGKSAIVPTRKILAHIIEETRAQGSLPEKSLLETVCHRMNEVYARDHITLETVRSVKHRASLEIARQSATKKDPEFEQLIRQVDTDQRNEIDALKKDLKVRDAQLAEKEATVSELETTINSLKYSLEAASESPSSTNNAGLSLEARDMLHAAMSNRAQLADALRVVALLFPDRVVILDSAWKAAKEAEAFEDPRKAFELLYTLCTDYWNALASGKSDIEARTVFGKSYSAKESETVEKNKKAQSLRTFVYNGKPVTMMKHLKIGVKDSVATTFRAHFEWDPAGKKIVIGHCGKHLDFK